MPKPLITLDVLQSLLDYNPDTGVFTWKVTRGRSAKAGDTAGHDCGIKGPKKRVVIGLQGRLYRAGRLAWLMMTGVWHSQVVDHEDGDYRNHRWGNLRDVSNRVNVENQRKAASSNKSSGLLGVTWDKQHGKWLSQITVDQKNKFLGRFDDPCLAHQAYLEAKRRLHAGCTI